MIWVRLGGQGGGDVVREEIQILSCIYLAHGRGLVDNCLPGICGGGTWWREENDMARWIYWGARKEVGIIPWHGVGSFE